MIIFDDIEYQNIRSVGSHPIKIQLNSDKVTNISGSNGSGKSTLIQALSFVLFGKPYGNITKNSLINSINQKNLLVTTNFLVNSKKYKVVRGIKPNVFEIYEDNTLLNQSATNKDYQKILEQQILKFNYRAFTQVIVVGGGSEYTPFMRLVSKDRRDFIEDLLDIKVFSSMNLLLKERRKIVRDELNMSDSRISNIKEKLILQESFIKKLNTDKKDSILSLEKSLEELQGVNDKLSVRFFNNKNELEKLKESVDDTAKLNSEKSDLTLALKYKNKQLQTKELEIKSNEDLAVCVTCNQKLEEKLKSDITTILKLDLNKIQSDVSKLVSKLSLIEVELNAHKEDCTSYESIKGVVTSLNTELYSNNQLINKYKTQIEAHRSDISNTEEESKKLKSFAKEYLTENKNKSILSESKDYYEYIANVLSDSGIKSRIVKQYIPTINSLINKYLDEFGFFVNFELDEEFNETIKSRHRDTFTYENFSAGQMRRIDIAILMTFIDIARAKNALNCNLCFLDEMDSSLDSESADILYDILKRSSIQNIFLISHKIDVFDNIADKTIKFKLVNNFTEIEF